jgi:uncharacterized protein
MRNEPDMGLARTIADVMAPYESVLLAYLFGSAAAGTNGPLSDIDIAVLVDRDASVYEIPGLLQDDLCRRLKTDRLDLISLTEAPPPLAYRVVRDGQCVLCRDRKVRESFETRAIMRYLDFKPLRDQAFRRSRQAILESV